MSQILSHDVASAAVKIAPAVGLPTLSFFNWPWAEIAAISGTIYSLTMVGFLIYDRIKGKNDGQSNH